MKIGIIGYGRIGKEIRKRVLERGWEVPIIVDSSGIYNSKGEKIGELNNWLEEIKRVHPNIIALAIPTFDDGQTAYKYIKGIVKLGIPVVTSEKGALGNYFSELKPWIAKIGYSATVGGGTRLLPWLKERLTSKTKEIHLIINGTLNYMFDGLSRGRALDEVAEETKKLGYAEPGAETAIEVVNTEFCKDLPMKVSCLLNLCGFGEIRAKEILVQPISEGILRKLVREANFRRCIVSITREENEEDIIGGFKFKLNGWYINGGFKNWTQNPLFLHLVPPGVNNAALIYGTEGTYTLSGPGAGTTPTVMGAIMKDIEDLLGIH